MSHPWDGPDPETLVNELCIQVLLPQEMIPRVLMCLEQNNIELCTLRLTEDIIVYVPRPKGAGPKPPEKHQTEVEALFADFCSFTRRSRDPVLQARCHNNERFISWNCCDTHRELDAEHYLLNKRAEALNISAGSAGIMSPAWWEAAGIKWPGRDKL